MPRVIVAGGGIAGVEAALAVRALAPEVEVELVSASNTFVHAPLSPLAVLDAAVPLHHDLAALVAPKDVAVRVDPLVEVTASASSARTRDGAELAYDRLVLAVGCRAESAVPGALTFVPGAARAVAAVFDELRSAAVHGLAVVVPSGVAWTLAAYELALAAARTAPGASITLVTAERAPLQALGSSTSGEIRSRLAAAGVALTVGGAARSFADGRLAVEPAGSLRVDRVVALPRPSPRTIRGIPTDEDGWVPVDPLGAVPGREGVYAVGDMTSEPLKHGGLAARQAGAVATVVAASLGADVEVELAAAVVEAVLIDAGEVVGALRSDLADPAGPALGWSADTEGAWHKVAAPHLTLALERLMA